MRYKYILYISLLIISLFGTVIFSGEEFIYTIEADTVYRNYINYLMPSDYPISIKDESNDTQVLIECSGNFNDLTDTENEYFNIKFVITETLFGYVKNYILHIDYKEETLSKMWSNHSKSSISDVIKISIKMPEEKSLKKLNEFESVLQDNRINFSISPESFIEKVSLQTRLVAWSNVIKDILFILLSISIIGYLLLSKTIKKFLKSSYSELKKVAWSGKKELIASTTVVIVSVAIIAFFTGLLDFIISKIMIGFYNLFS